MYMIQTDIQIARRQRLHLVLDESETVAWTGKNIADALDWLSEHGQTEVNLVGEGCQFLVKFAKVLG